MLKLKRLAAAKPKTFVFASPLIHSTSASRMPVGMAEYASQAKPPLDSIAAVGKVCDPREKSQRVLGREREAGCAARIGISKKVSVKMPPEAIKLVLTERMSAVLVASEPMI
jgi:hypothetical protein